MPFPISTHAPRTGSDWVSPFESRSASNFNPRSPHGERRVYASNVATRNEFQPTLPARGATLQSVIYDDGDYDFNPRSPHGERRSDDPTFTPSADFNPRSPHGERQGRGRRKPSGSRISTHAPRTGSDLISL